MSEQKLELAIAFLESHPDIAATILEQLPASDVANLLQEIPRRVAAVVLERMLPQYTARICKIMPPSAAAALLGLMNFSIVSAVLRHSGSELRKQLIELLPEKTKLACLLLLDFPENTIGAWMVVQAMCVAGDSTAQQAIQQLTEQNDLVATDRIFVIDRNRLVLGELSFAALLRADRDQLIASLIEAKTPVLPARTKLETAHLLEIWEHRDSAAIINKQNQFVGVLRHVDLRRGLAQIANEIETPSGSDPITSLLSVYGNSLFSLLDTVGEFANTRNR